MESNRTSPQTNDILVFQSSTTVTNVPNQAVGSIVIANGTSVSLQTSTSNRTLIVSDSVVVNNGCALTIGDNGST